MNRFFVLFVFGFIFVSSFVFSLPLMQPGDTGYKSFGLGGWTPITELMRGNATILKEDGFYRFYLFKPPCMFGVCN